jgi:hypothetical protein
MSNVSRRAMRGARVDDERYRGEGMSERSELIDRHGAELMPTTSANEEKA